MKFKLYADPSALSPFNYPILGYAIDRDDYNVPASVNALKEHGNYKERILRPNRWVSIRFKPNVLIPYLGSGLSVSTTGFPAYKFVDCAQTNVPHFGLKYFIDNMINTSMYVQTDIKMWFTCKDTR